MARAKLTPEQKEEIYRLYHSKDERADLKSLAKTFGVSVTLVHRVANRIDSKSKYKEKKPNTGKCQFCQKALKGKRVDAIFCNAACKANYRRLGPKRTRLRRKRRFPPLKKEIWLAQEFGALRLVDSPDLPDEWRSRSNQEFVFLCSCGRKTTQQFQYVTRGTIKSCGQCRSTTSRESDSLHEFVKSLFPDAKRSVRGVLKDNPAMEFDTWVPSQNLAVEYHGLLWHSVFASPQSNTTRDYRKYKLCRDQGIRLIQIYSDDWINRRSVFEDMLSRMSPGYSAKRAYVSSVEEIDRQEAQKFLDSNHYLSGSEVTGSLYVGLKDKRGGLVAVSVFTRDGKGGVTWNRHAVKTGTKTWQPAGKCLDFAIQRLRPSKVVSFSDNRLHTGKTYESLGFRLDGYIGRSYCYTNGRVRIDKRRGRVKASIDEEGAAIKKGWYRLYDSDKKRWVLDL